MADRLLLYCQQKIQNTTDTGKGQAVQFQRANQRSFLEILRSLRVSGYMSLELVPLKPVLPDLRFCDGDQIMLSTLAVCAGLSVAVLAEASMNHRPGHSLSDHLAKVGVTRDADMNLYLNGHRPLGAI